MRLPAFPDHLREDNERSLTVSASHFFAQIRNDTAADQAPPGPSRRAAGPEHHARGQAGPAPEGIVDVLAGFGHWLEPARVSRLVVGRWVVLCAGRL